MANITVDKLPGFYAGPIQVNVTVNPLATKVIITPGATPPVLSDIIAYDQGPLGTSGPIVQRPFMALTRDGRGNVVYDSGCPHYMRRSWPAGTPYPTTFSGLPGAWKFLHNALNYCANPNKVAEGNRKVLFIGNAGVTDAYPLKTEGTGTSSTGVGQNGFRKVFDTICAIAGYEPTYLDVDDYTPRRVNTRLSTMEPYVLVVFVASNPTSVGATFVTPTFTQDLATYRTQGNGVIVITDHCNAWYTGLADAVTRGAGYGADATKVTQYYGTWFTGDVNRNPVKVGEIRRQLIEAGESPDLKLFANLGDNESIDAGVSESLVYVEKYEDYIVDASEVHTYDLTTPGIHYVNVLVALPDESVEVQTYRYDIGTVSDFTLRDNRGRVIGATFPTIKRAFDLSVTYNVANPPSMTGYVIKNGEIYGTFVSNDLGISVNYIGYKPFAIKNGDVVGFRIQQPYIYEVTTTVNLTPTDLGKVWVSYPQTGTSLIAAPDYNGLSKLDAMHMHYAYLIECFKDPSELVGNVFGILPRTLPRFNRGEDGFVGAAYFWLYTTEADFIASPPKAVGIGDVAIASTTNVMYVWWLVGNTPQWVKWHLTCDQFFEVGQMVYDRGSKRLYPIDTLPPI